MKNMIFKENGNLSIVEKMVKVLAIILGIVGVLFFPAVYFIPIASATACVVMAIRAGYSWRRAAWGIAALASLTFASPLLSTLFRGVAVGAFFYYATKRDEQENPQTNSEE